MKAVCNINLSGGPVVVVVVAIHVNELDYSLIHCCIQGGEHNTDAISHPSDLPSGDSPVACGWW